MNIIGVRKKALRQSLKDIFVSHSYSDEEHKQEVNNSIHKGSHFSTGIKFFFYIQDLNLSQRLS